MEQIHTPLGMLLQPDISGSRYLLNSATAMPQASGFLWNRHMMLHINCRGFIKSQYMQPEPSVYSYAPNLEQRTFIQPEPAYYAHHPGRFVYVKDESSGELFSVPFEPAKKQTDFFQFSVGQADICWILRHLDLEVIFELALPVDDVVELWTLSVRDLSGRSRRLSIYTYFSIGYMSWMNQSATYRDDLGGIVASCVSPYQKVEDAEKITALKDKTFLLHDTEADAWETSLAAFEGASGLTAPAAIQQLELGKGDALYETPVGALQYRFELAPSMPKQLRFVFGPAKNDTEIESIRYKYLNAGGFESASTAYKSYLESGRGCLKIKSPDTGLDNFVNQWLARQVFYHGDVNRLTTDPQTRNYLQDAMGLAYINASSARSAFLLALSQQQADGQMPDGILLHPDAELKYINQVPHSDHCVWLPICLQSYLDESGDSDMLDEPVKGQFDQAAHSVFKRITLALRWLINDRDSRGLSYIAQGDWCDPMNMVGHKGKGVSAWLSIATVWALRSWAKVCDEKVKPKIAGEMRAAADEISAAVQTHLWDGNWFARGITDDNVKFGIAADNEGRIYLNPQSWALLAGIPDLQQEQRILKAVEDQLEGPHGVAMLAPAYTQMRDDVGRLTQKFPGTAENGSVYNHASAFFVYALYKTGDKERAWRILRQMLPGPDLEDYLQRGQLPVFIPNYYRGAGRQLPAVAGRSSQLFNTGTVSWFYRILIDGLFGVKGNKLGLQINPQLPAHWQQASIVRDFRGARFTIQFNRNSDQQGIDIILNGRRIDGDVIKDFIVGQEYNVEVSIGADR